MHELGIAQDFWAVIKEQASANNLKRVTTITIVIGETSGIEKSFLEHSLRDHIIPGTFAEHARLEIIIKPLAAKCRSCGLDISKDTMSDFNCPGCGGTDIEIISGKESYVQSIEGE